MNSALPEMLQCVQTSENIAGNGTDMTVLERQRGRLKWQQQQLQSQQLQQSYFNENQLNLFSLSQTQHYQDLMNNDSAFRELANQSMKVDPDLENGWPNFTKYPIPRTGFCGEMKGFVSSGLQTDALEMDYSISRTSSCPPAEAVAMAGDEKGIESVLTEKLASTVGRDSFKKRKADKAQNPKVIVAGDVKVKKIKGDAEEVESKITEQNNSSNNRETSADTSKENSKVTEVQKPDYIHVRARRGQATDSHSLAERVRREKISERMKYLQDLVPGCNKITGKAGMLEEIINYVQSLQRQVEFLSMKLATVNPRLEFNIENFFAKELFSACPDSFPSVGMPSEIVNPAYLQFNPAQQVVSCGLDMAVNSSDMGLRRTNSSPVPVPETFLDSSSFTQAQLSTIWETDLQNIYNVEFHQGRSSAFPSQAFTGSMEANNLKMEM
ncbi:hypothetical protein HHK36_010141 [Tetracentron sinense]|uniref:BHLH domain-containing protein n=1 Tax=Tetracentron sinense TaxID=13715 RepID=A0A834ZGD8_TETSI|nr:hypothetical protein HHK36_010141 [Tetracentron sinense]